MTPGTTTIAVGVDGTPESMTAASWAATEAHRRAGTLWVVHASLPATYAPTHEAEILGRQAAGETTVASTVASLRSSHPELDIVAVTRMRPVIDLLNDVSRQADALVVGKRSRRRLRDLLDLSVSTEISGRAACPVVTVPTIPADTAGPVVAVVDAADPCASGARIAFSHAQRTSRRVVVMGVVADDAAPQIIERAYRAMNSVAEAATDQFPGCRYRTQLVNGTDRRSVVDAVDDPSLIVLTRPPRQPLRLAWTRSLAHRVHRTAQCPVVIAERWASSHSPSS